MFLSLLNKPPLAEAPGSDPAGVLWSDPRRLSKLGSFTASKAQGGHHGQETQNQTQGAGETQEHEAQDRQTRGRQEAGPQTNKETNKKKTTEQQHTQHHHEQHQQQNPDRR